MSIKRVFTITCIVLAVIVSLSLADRGLSSGQQQALKIYRSQIPASSSYQQPISTLDFLKKPVTVVSDLVAPTGECACTDAQLQACGLAGYAVRNWCIAMGGTEAACTEEGAAGVVYCVSLCNKSPTTTPLGN